MFGFIHLIGPEEYRCHVLCCNPTAIELSQTLQEACVVWFSSVVWTRHHHRRCFSFATKKQWRQSSSGLAAGAMRKTAVSVVCLARVNGKYKERGFEFDWLPSTRSKRFITLISFVHFISAAHDNWQHLTYTINNDFHLNTVFTTSEG